MGKSVSGIKQIKDNNLNEIKSTKSELVTALVENVIKTKKTIKKSDNTEKL